MSGRRYKDFGGESDEYDELGFTLWGEDFECYPQVQGVSLLGFVKEAASGDGARAADALLGFFSTVMPEGEFTRFDKLWKDPKRVVSIEKIGEIAEWLTEQYSERPTKASSSSSNGRSRSGRTSTAKRSSKVSTSEPSA